MADEIWAADWVAALAEMPNIDRDREVTVETQRGSNYSYKYATLANVIEQTRSVLAKHNWAFAQEVRAENGSVEVVTRFYHTSGQELPFGPLRLPAGSNPQQAGSAITYARRYALTAALGLATEDDDDGASAARPQPETPQVSPAEWLSARVAIFKEWPVDERREKATEIAKEIGAKKPLSQDEAERIFEMMASAYYEQFPGDETAPF